MIDLHCHLLPGIDDGPSTVEQSVAIARAALEDGVRTIVATPHGAEWSGDYTGPEDVLERLDALRGELEWRRMKLELLPGVEIYLTPDAPELLAQGRLFGLNRSRYLLVELPQHYFPPYAENVLFELQLRGQVPLIAHPERNAALSAEPEMLRRLVERGMLAQVTAGSIMGDFGARTRAAAEAMLCGGLVQVIATDAHSAVGRSPSLSSAVRRASELVGQEAALAMVTTIPSAILRDQHVEPPRLQPARRRSWFPFSRR